MVNASNNDFSLAITGSGGAGSITAGELLLSLAGKNGFYAMMRRSFGPQIRGGEAAALIRVNENPVNCMDDRFDLLLALDWRNADRFAEEISLHPDSLIIADPSAGAVPDSIQQLGAKILAIPMKSMAKEVDKGRPNMVALGVLSRWLGLCRDEAARLIEATFTRKGEEIVSGSQQAFDKGFDEPLIAEVAMRGSDSPLARLNGHEQRWHINGNQACGLGALRGGVRFAAAYPITPASDLLEWLAPRLSKLGGSLLQAEDELASINMVIGASFGGVPSLTATSGPGLALMTEGMGLAVAAEVPAVVVNVMRGGPSTGIPTKSEQVDLNLAVYGLHGDAPHLVLGALDHADCMLTTEWAVRLAEAMQTVAIVLTDQNLAQSRSICPQNDYRLPEIPPRATAMGDEPYQRYLDAPSGVSPMAVPGQSGATYVADGLEHDERGKPSTAAADHQRQLDKRLRKIQNFEFGDHWAEIEGSGEVAIVTWGSCTGAAREACERLAQQGQAVRLVALRLLLPASPEKLASALEGVSRILVVEQSHGQQFAHYLRAFYDIAGVVSVLSRPGPLPIGPAEIVDRLENWS